MSSKVLSTLARLEVKLLFPKTSNTNRALGRRLREMGNLSSQFVGRESRSISNEMDNRNGGDGGGGAGAASAEDKDLKKNVEELLGQERIVIFSKESCPYCYDAKNVFDKMGQKYAVVELNQHPHGSNVQDILGDMTGARTVPRVFIDGKCIGGGSDTVTLFKTGRLEQMLSEECLDSETKSKNTPE